MHSTEYKILIIFKRNPETEISTSQILKKTYPKTYKRIDASFKSKIKDKEKLLTAKRDKARLHRRLLYHLNRLIKEGILKVIKEGSKGEKYFSLALEKGEELTVEKHKRKLIISKPLMPAMAIEGHEQKGWVAKFETATWIDRVNSILLECKNLRDIEKLNKAIEDSFSCVNDAIGLNNFEFIIENCDENELKNFLKKIRSECKDYGKKISCIIELKNLKNNNKLLEIMRYYTKLGSDGHIDFVFGVKTKWMQDNLDFFKKLIDIFSNKRRYLYIKNNDLLSAPYIVGKAGGYTFDLQEWEIYQNELQKESYGVICSQSSIAIDVKQFLEENKTPKSFRIFVRKMARSLLSANSLQRRRAEEYFKPILWLMNDPRELFRFGRNYIRLWNYGWKEPKMDQEFVVELMNSTRESIDRFCIVEEIIYKSCGMPTRFRIAFSSAFREFKEDSFFSKGNFPKIEIKNTKEIYSKELKDILVGKEKLFEIFSGGDRARFFRSGEVDPDDICREFNIIMVSYRLPLFCYDFGEVKGTNLKLTSFI